MQHMQIDFCFFAHGAEIGTISLALSLEHQGPPPLPLIRGSLQLCEMDVHIFACLLCKTLAGPDVSTRRNPSTNKEF